MRFVNAQTVVQLNDCFIKSLYIYIIAQMTTERKKPKYPRRCSVEVSDVRILDEMRALTVDSPYSFNYLAEEAFKIALPALKLKVKLAREAFSSAGVKSKTGGLVVSLWLGLALAHF
jgi:hypothetical protein